MPEPLPPQATPIKLAHAAGTDMIILRHFNDRVHELRRDDGWDRFMTPEQRVLDLARNLCGVIAECSKMESDDDRLLTFGTDSDVVNAESVRPCNLVSPSRYLRLDGDTDTIMDLTGKRFEWMLRRCVTILDEEREQYGLGYQTVTQPASGLD